MRAEQKVVWVCEQVEKYKDVEQCAYLSCTSRAHHENPKFAHGDGGVDGDGGVLIISASSPQFRNLRKAADGSKVRLESRIESTVLFCPTRGG
jgi:hypothetical protein